MKYNFDEIINRDDTYSLKYDGAEKFIGTNDKNVLPLWVADMDFKVAPSISKALQQRAKHEIYGYSVLPQKLDNLITSWLYKFHQWKIDTKWLNYPPGILVGIGAAVLAFTKPGDKIIVQKPVYFPFFKIIENLSRELVNNELIENNLDYFIDFEDLEKKASQGAKMLILSNPHNPVGRVWQKEELIKIAEIAKKYKLLVISDEAHADFVFDSYKHTPYANVSKDAEHNSITLMALSKGFNVAGLYCAYSIIKNKKLNEQYTKWLDGMMLVHGRNVFTDHVFLSAYSQEGEQWLKEVKQYVYENMIWVDKFLQTNLKSIKMKLPEATFLLWLDFRKLGLTQSELIKFLTTEAKIGLHSGTIFGESFKGFMRMNLAHPRAIIKEALYRLEKAYSDNISIKI